MIGRLGQWKIGIDIKNIFEPGYYKTGHVRIANHREIFSECHGFTTAAATVATVGCDKNKTTCLHTANAITNPATGHNVSLYQPLHENAYAKILVCYITLYMLYNFSKLI